MSYNYSSIIDVENGQPKNPHEMVNRLRQVFKTKKTFPISYRKKQLRNLLDFARKEEDALCKAMYQDFKKPREETIVHELLLFATEVRVALENIDDWSKPEHVKSTLVNFFDDLYIYSDPLGVVLIIGAWNYPIQLSLCPLISKYFFIILNSVPV